MVIWIFWVIGFGVEVFDREFFFVCRIGSDGNGVVFVCLDCLVVICFDGIFGENLLFFGFFFWWFLLLFELVVLFIFWDNCWNNLFFIILILGSFCFGEFGFLEIVCWWILDGVVDLLLEIKFFCFVFVWEWLFVGFVVVIVVDGVCLY